MSDTENQEPVREATRIFLRLREDPDDAALQADRDAFLARGEAERAAYEKLTRAWHAARKGRRPRIAGRVALLALVVGGFYFGAEPLRTHLLADHKTGRTHAEIVLGSGDLAALDAESAIADDTDDGERAVTLLRGAAYFDVETSDRRFSVEAGEVTVTVTGTAFEVSRVRDSVLVAVSEGRVEVSIDDRDWALASGDRLKWSEDGGAVLGTTDVQNIAAWRQGQLVTDGMTFGEVAEVLDRRLPGEVFVTDGALARSSVSGGLDLRRPEEALETLAAVRGAKVVSVTPFVRLVLPDR